METGRKSLPIKTLRDIRKPANSRRTVIRSIHSRPAKTEAGFRLAFLSEFFTGFRPASIRKKYLQAAGILFVGAISLYMIFIGFFTQSTINTFRLTSAELPGLQASAQNLNTGEAVTRLNRIYGSVRKITDDAKKYGIAAMSSALGEILPGFGEIPNLLSDAATLNEKTLRIAQDLDFLKTNGIELLTSQRGKELISTLERVEKNMNALSDAGGKLSEQSVRLGYASDRLASVAQIFSEKYAPIDIEITKTKDFLHSLVAFLKEPEDRHILLIFQNPTEIRPAGGFIGSFGDLIINNGNLKEIKIDDIYNADRQLNLKLLPPKELSGITPTWGARDANWFFDFPTSAKKVSSLLEESNLYKLKGIEFHGAIAINTDILQSLLAVTGPIALEKYNLTITPQNFLKELQREVEAGQDKKPGQNPKRILSALAPLLMEKLGSLSADQKSDLVLRFKNHLEQKDIMIWFRDWQMQNFFESMGVAGDVLQLPGGFSGDYLAVIDANIASGKTDAVISQSISLKSAINSDGGIVNELSVTRFHDGAGEKDWWYRVANRNYLKVLVPENSTLLSMRGNDAPPEYSQSKDRGLHYDLDLAAIEKTASLLDAFNAFIGKESGKFSFGAWMTTEPGRSKTVTLQYQNGINIDIHDSMKYEFIFEKQSGVESSLEYSIAAPPGYIWKESGRNIFEYGTQQIKAREIVTLNLVKA